MIYRFLFLLPFLLLLHPTEVRPARIAVDFQAHVLVSGPRIVLGDIAVIRFAGEQTEALAKLPVASSPAPGKSKELYTVSVIKAMRNRKEVAGVDWQGSPTIVVERPANRISREKIETILLEYLKENSPNLPRAEIRLTVLRTPEELVVPAGALSWKVSSSRPGILGSTSFSIAFAVNGESVTNCVVRARLEALGEVVVAALPLQKGNVLAERSIRLEKRDLCTLKDPFTATDQVLGMEMARTIEIGTVLDRDTVAAPTVIKQGDLVQLIARKGALQITTNGQAQTNGRQGEMIKVKNSSTNKLVYGRVDGPGMVSVEF